MSGEVFAGVEECGANEAEAAVADAVAAGVWDTADEAVAAQQE